MTLARTAALCIVGALIWIAVAALCNLIITTL